MYPSSKVYLLDKNDVLVQNPVQWVFPCCYLLLTINNSTLPRNDTLYNK